jgi:chemotaxis methyl-accepting protein methylase
MTAAVDDTVELARWEEYIERRCGMSFASRQRVLAACLGERIKAGGFRTPLDYYHHVVAHPSGGREWNALFALFLNGETKFFRDAAGFQALRQRVIPELRSRTPQLRLWSAGCSSGQEAYSLAIACLEQTAGTDCQDEILGTDVSAATVARAAAGRYRRFEARGLSEQHERRHFVADGADIRVAESLRQRVMFRTLDLTADRYPLSEQHVIFCQNVLIYYTPEARAEMVRKLGQALAPGGYLFLGPAEGLGLPTPRLDLVHLDEAWAYRRR